MPQQRRTPRAGGSGSGSGSGSATGGGKRPGSGPGRSRQPGAQRSARSARPRAAAASATAPVPPVEPRRPRFTGRFVVLLLVLGVLAVSYASSTRAYLQQRSHIADLKQAIAEREASIDDLEREKRRWEDPAYVKAQARSRFGYLMPGETGFQVLDEDGKPLESESTLHDPDDVVRTKPTAWWTSAWDSVELAGHPPAADEGRPDVIDGTKQ